MAVVATFTADTRGRQRVGRQKQVTGVVDPVGTYETNGFAVTPALFGLSAIDSLTINDNPSNGTEFMVAKYVPATGLIKLGWGGGAVSSELDEITNADTCTGFIMGVTVRGVG